MFSESPELLASLFKSSRQKGENGLPLLSVTLNNGLVARDLLDRRAETNLSPKEHLMVKKGDIAYNMMRVWQGALGRATVDGLVSPAYIVLRPTKKIDSLYAEYLFKTPQLIYKFWAYSYGLTKDRLRLYYKDFSRISVTIPEVEAQKKIAKILSLWDKSINTTEHLFENSKQQKKALMQQLLTGKNRLLDDSGSPFEGVWRELKISDICEINPKKPLEPQNGLVSFIPMNAVSDNARLLKIETKNYSEVEKGFTSFINGDTLIAKITPCFENGKGAQVSNLKNGIGFGSTEFHVLRAKNNFCPRFIYSLTNTAGFRKQGKMNMQGSAGHKRVTTDYLKVYKVKVPALLKEQQKISDVLASADKEVELLERHLADLKQEKKALMQQLLTGKKRVIINVKDKEVAC